MLINKMFKKTLIGVVILLLLLSGCSDDDDLQGTGQGNEMETISSNLIYIPVERIRTLNPILSKDEDAYYLNNLVYQGLFTLNANLEAVGVLAESYEYTATGSLLLHLAKGVTWHDGNAFSAEDVKFSIDAYKSVPVNKQGLHAEAVSLIKSVKVTDPFAVEIQFVDQNNAAIENLTFPILPAHKFKRPADMLKAEEDFFPMGTGPYWVSNIEEGRQIALSGNPGFKGSVPKNILAFKFMPGKADSLNLFELGEINLTYLRDVERDTLIEKKSVNIVSFTANEAEVLGFNFSHGALQQADVRKAIAHAVDSDIILETCYFNSGILNDSIYYPGYLGSETGISAYGQDVSKGRELLKASGNEGLSLRLIFNSDNHSRNLAAGVIRANLEKIGINVEAIPLIKEDYEKSLAKGDYDLYIGGFMFGENYDLRPLLHTGGAMNYIRYSNIRMDELLTRMQQGITPEERRDVFKELHALYKEEIPYLCLLYKTYGFAASKDLQGEINPYFYNVYNGCEKWRMTYQKPAGQP
ncbi:ABC transporter substrate-binding protein [Bacillota bacterium]